MYINVYFLTITAAEATIILKEFMTELWANKGHVISM